MNLGGGLTNEIVADIKYYTGAALTGLLSNPMFTTIEYQKNLGYKGLTLEKLALKSAIEIVSELEQWKDKVVKRAEAEKTKLTVVDEPHP